jgi:hypothetical protein
MKLTALLGRCSLASCRALIAHHGCWCVEVILGQLHEEVTAPRRIPSVAGDTAYEFLAITVDPHQRSLALVADPDVIVHFE